MAGQPRRREFDFMIDLLDFVERSRARYATEKNVPIEEVTDKTAIWNFPDEFRQRWLKSNGERLSYETLHARYQELKKYHIATREWALRPTPLQEDSDL